MNGLHGLKIPVKHIFRSEKWIVRILITLAFMLMLLAAISDSLFTCP